MSEITEEQVILSHISQSPELLTGTKLKDFVFHAKDNIKVISENFLYQKSIIMMSGDPGVGKSTINANIVRDLSCGAPLFNFFHTPKPAIAYYVPFERGAYEMADRLKSLSGVLEPCWENIIIKPDFIGFDMFDQKQADTFVNSVILDLNYFRGLKIEVVVMLDPIISMVSGEIKEEKYAKAITRVANQIQTKTDCALILTNHTTKAASNKKGEHKVDPFYGSQVFKAFCTSGIHVSKNKDYGGVNMTSTKSSHGNSIEQCHLQFDDMTYSLFGKVDVSGLKNYDKVLATVRALRLQGITNFTFNNIKKHNLCFGVSPSSIKDIVLNHEPFKSGIKSNTGIGVATTLSFTTNWVN